MKMTLPPHRKAPNVSMYVCRTNTLAHLQECVSSFELSCSWSKIHFPKTCHKNANFI